MHLLVRYLIPAGALAIILGLWVTAPQRAEGDALNGIIPDPAAGEYIFAAAGCSSCHAAPDAEGDDKLILSGGEPFASDFGTFFAPNISPSEAGIGGWETLDLLNALRHGTSPEGKHYYPAFPYTSYQHMRTQDVADLHAYLKTLPPSPVASLDHEVGFPFNIRRGLGGWKLLFLGSGYTLGATGTAQVTRGRYLVEALGHCGECHTPRGALGQLDRSAWLTGAANPSGKGRVPGITPEKLNWSADDIAYYLETGFTPDFDTAGAKMATVVANTAKLSPEDRAAIAAYLQSVGDIAGN